MLASDDVAIAEIEKALEGIGDMKKASAAMKE
jgi:hypothetical protein